MGIVLMKKVLGVLSRCLTCKVRILWAKAGLKKTHLPPPFFPDVKDSAS